MTVNVQRMVDGPGDYRITGKSYGAGISAAPVSGKFGADGSGTSTVEIKVADSVRDGYYPLVLTTKAGKGDQDVHARRRRRGGRGVRLAARWCSARVRVATVFTG